MLFCIRTYVCAFLVLECKLSGLAILGSKLCIPNCIVTLTATLMEFLDPISRFADATAAPVERRSAHVPRLRLPFAIWWCAAAKPTVIDVFDVQSDEPGSQGYVLISIFVQNVLVECYVGGQIFGDGIQLTGRVPEVLVSPFAEFPVFRLVVPHTLLS